MRRIDGKRGRLHFADGQSGVAPFEMLETPAGVHRAAPLTLVGWFVLVYSQNDFFTGYWLSGLRDPDPQGVFPNLQYPPQHPN